MMKIRTILHPTDFSEHSANALELAGAIARDYGARLTILHVKALPITPSGVMTPEPMEPPGYATDLRRQLDALKPAVPVVSVEHVMLVGDEATEITRLAADEGYDLIVMGTHGRTGVGRLLMGSVAEKVLRLAQCPVLTVKRPGPAAKPGKPIQPRVAVTAG
jgi:nucleotide-binding universal stress UspA family protein